MTVEGTPAIDRGRPLVSVVLTTRDRPRLLPVALACYRHQSYPHRELIVVDDGDRFPADAAAVVAAGGRLIRVEPGTPLGEKLNRGAGEARGPLCQKMDDDDWYAPDFLRTMVDALLASWRIACRPTVAFVAPFLFFDLARWEVRRSVENNLPGATLLFGRDDWAERPFRALPGDEDLWFLRDQARLGAAPLLVRSPESFVAIRHGGTAGRGHTWVHQTSGETLEAYLRHRPLHPGGPEALFPGWALDVYRGLRAELAADGAPTEPAAGEGGEPDAVSTPEQPRVLILTPVKDASPFIPRFVENLRRLTYPRDRISIGLLESDSVDGTYGRFDRLVPALREEFRRVGLWKRDFGFRLPKGTPRWEPSLQPERRSVLARSRNHLLARALDDEDWVLWLDVDVVDYPADLIEQLLATGKEIVQAHCVLDPGGPSFDRNAWRDQGSLHLDDLRREGDLVRLDAVGGASLLVRADLHRQGLVFPTFPYGRANPLARPGDEEVETEGLGIMAHDMGYQAWGMPHLEVIHRRG